MGPFGYPFPSVRGGASATRAARAREGRAFYRGPARKARGTRGQRAPETVTGAVQVTQSKQLGPLKVARKSPVKVVAEVKVPVRV